MSIKSLSWMLPAGVGLLCSACGEEPRVSPPLTDDSAEVSSLTTGSDVESLGPLSLTLPGDLWRRDDEVTSILTLKRGEAGPEAVARFYLNGRDDIDETALRRDAEQRQQFLEELARGLRDQIELAAGGGVEFVEGPVYSTEPYLAAGYRYLDERGGERFFNLDTAFYVGGCYFFLDLACGADRSEELLPELEALRTSARINLPAGETRELDSGERVTLGALALTIPAEGWTLRTLPEGLLLSKNGLELLVYRRIPTSGSGEGAEIAEGLRAEILDQDPTAVFEGEPLKRSTPAPFAALTYTCREAGRTIRRYDAALLLGEEFYLLDGRASTDAESDARRELAALVDSAAPLAL